jgi:hypothetical protein
MTQEGLGRKSCFHPFAVYVKQPPDAKKTDAALKTASVFFIGW